MQRIPTRCQYVSLGCVRDMLGDALPGGHAVTTSPHPVDTTDPERLLRCPFAAHAPHVVSRVGQPCSEPCAYSSVVSYRDRLMWRRIATCLCAVL